MPEAKDSDFSWKDFQARVNNELADTFGAHLVVAFVEAFNQHDVDAMLDLSHPDVRWMSVDG